MPQTPSPQVLNRQALKQLLYDRGIRQKDLSQKTNIHYNTISSWINGASRPPRQKIQRMADALGVAISVLLTSPAEDAAQTTRVHAEFNRAAANKLLFRLGITQRELAQRMDIPRQTISNWFCGLNSPPLSKIALLAEALGVETDTLVTIYETAPTPPPPPPPRPSVSQQHGLRCPSCGGKLIIAAG